MDDIYDVLRAYQDNPTTITTGDLLTDGIILLNEYVNETVLKYNTSEAAIGEIFATCITPLARYLTLNIYVHNRKELVMVEHLQWLAKFIRDLHRKYYLCKCDGSIPEMDLLEKKFTEYIKLLIVTPFTKSITDEAKESIVTSCAPMVPYVGTLTTMPSVNNVVPQFKTESVSKLYDLITNPVKLQLVLDHLNELPIDDDGSLLLHIAAPSSSKLPPVVIEYMTHFYVYKCWENLKDPVHKAASIQTLFNVANESTENLFNAVMDFVPDSPSKCLESLEEVDSLTDTIQKFGGTVISSTDEMPAFDIDYLMAFIFTHREFRVNFYTNSAFANLPSIASISFYKDFMLIQPSDDNGKALPYLYVPIINDLAESQIQVIKYFADRRIIVLTQDQYMHDINRTNAE